MRPVARNHRHPFARQSYACGVSDLRVRRRPSKAVRRRRFFVIVGAATVLVLGITGGVIAAVAGNANNNVAASATATKKPTATKTPTATPTPTPSPVAPEVPVEPPVVTPPAAPSIDDPTSPTFVVNKLRPTPNGASYVPPDLVDLRSDIPNPNGHMLRADTAAALALMVDAAMSEAGVQLVAQSGYRSYESQVSAYDYYVNELGTEGADLTSARPGHSEHQTGMALDILDTSSGCGVEGPCFGDTTAGKWLVENGHRFGFVLRYPADKTPVTGYEYEPWHFRWVGVDTATAMKTGGVTTLEEFFGLPAAPGYAG